jgi:hypothetical protein
MSKIVQIVEEMRTRLNEITESEEELVRALREVLSCVDQKLLRDVQSVTTEHEVRRSSILHELRDLASRIGAFPTERDPMAAIAFRDHMPRAAAAANDIHFVPAAGDRCEDGVNVAPFPTARDPIVRPEYASRPAAAANSVHPHFTGGGDWRQAASNIEDDLDIVATPSSSN